MKDREEMLTCICSDCQADERETEPIRLLALHHESLPESDLFICLTEAFEGGPRGLRIGSVWYGKDEALAIEAYIRRHRAWLTAKKHDEQARTEEKRVTETLP